LATCVYLLAIDGGLVLILQRALNVKTRVIVIDRQRGMSLTWNLDEQRGKCNQIYGRHAP